MFSTMFHDDFIMLIGALFLWKSYNYRRTRTYTRRIFRHRNTHSEFLLINEMQLYDEESHMKYFRMDRVKFDFLLSKVGPHLLHAGTHEFPINAKQRPCVTLRLLSTGDPLTTLSFAFRMGKSTVTKIMEETCDALNKVLQQEYLPAPNESYFKKIAHGRFTINQVKYCNYYCKCCIVNRTYFSIRIWRMLEFSPLHWSHQRQACEDSSST